MPKSNDTVLNTEEALDRLLEVSKLIYDICNNDSFNLEATNKISELLNEQKIYLDAVNLAKTNDENHTFEKILADNSQKVKEILELNKIIVDKIKDNKDLKETQLRELNQKKNLLKYISKGKRNDNRQQ